MKTRIYLLSLIFAMSVLGAGCDKEDDPANQEPEVEEIMSLDDLQGIWETMEVRYEKEGQDDIVLTNPDDFYNWGYYDLYMDISFLDWLIKFDGNNISIRTLSDDYDDFNPDYDVDNINWFGSNYISKFENNEISTDGYLFSIILDYNPEDNTMVMEMWVYQIGSLFGYDRIVQTFKKVK